MQRKKISWVRLDLAPVEVEEEVVAVVEEGEDSPPAVEAEAGSHPEVADVVEEVVVEEEGEAVEAEGVEEVWEPGRKLSSSLTDTPGSSLPVGRKMPW